MLDERQCPHCHGTGRVQRVDPAILIPAIAARVGDLDFNARELRDHAAVDPVLAAALGARSARSIGKLLTGMVGKSIDGVTIRRIGSDRDGAIWRVWSKHADPLSLPGEQ